MKQIGQQTTSRPAESSRSTVGDGHETTRTLSFALLTNVAIAVAEVVGGLVTSSPGLLSEPDTPVPTA